MPTQNHRKNQKTTLHGTMPPENHLQKQKNTKQHFARNHARPQPLCAEPCPAWCLGPGMVPCKVFFCFFGFPQGFLKAWFHAKFPNSVSLEGSNGGIKESHSKVSTGIPGGGAHAAPAAAPAARPAVLSGPCRGPWHWIHPESHNLTTVTRIVALDQPGEPESDNLTTLTRIVTLDPSGEQ